MFEILLLISFLGVLTAIRAILKEQRRRRKVKQQWEYFKTIEFEKEIGRGKSEKITKS